MYNQLLLATSTTLTRMLFSWYLLRSLPQIHQQI